MRERINREREERERENYGSQRKPMKTGKEEGGNKTL
jgi:ribosomal protein L44E